MKTPFEKAKTLLQQLIAIPSFSKEESRTAALLVEFLEKEKIPVQRKANNIWAASKLFDASKPVLLLNSHHDTVQPAQAWTKDPFSPAEEDGKLFGLGSNDAGAALCCLLLTFLHFYEKEMSFNLVFAATAEEEISGKNGIELILPELGRIDLAIVGEPTQMQLAVAEKGLLVLDCVSYGKAGHAARVEGENAIYKALKDIEWFRSFSFPEISKWLGPVKMTVTQIEAGKQHNVIPDSCSFTVDVRLTDAYSAEEMLQLIRAHVDCEVTPRSTRLRPSSIPENHPLVLAAKKMNRKLYGSPTTSDQALLPFPSVKIGPGDSARSHTADEFILLSEIEEGITLYIRLLEQYGKELVKKELFAPVPETQKK